jgi:hypothetical protein
MLRGYIGTRPVNPTKGVLTLAEHREWVARGTVIGVQHKGTGTTDGWDLRQVSLLGDVNYGAYVREITRTSEYFDTHPSYQFNDWTDAAGNVFCEVPRAYWWRGMLPDAIDGTTPRWTMLLSPNQIPGFAASPGAFKRAGVWLDKFYYGKYRGYNAGDNKVGSQPGKTAWGNVTFNDFRTYCANNGEGYHLQSLFEWHEILGRMVIERCTFQLMPQGIRADAALCKYRGIEDFCYSSTVYAEWMDGIRTGSSVYQMWDEADGTYKDGGNTTSNNYIQSISDSENLDFLFIAKTTGSAVATSMIPNYCGGTSSGRVCHADFSASSAYYGAFYSRFNDTASDASSAIGGRLAKW